MKKVLVLQNEPNYLHVVAHLCSSDMHGKFLLSALVNLSETA